MEEEIIQPIDRELLKSELTPDKQLRMTNKSHNEIYIVTANDSPNVLKEIGRLREIAFREAGGGTGKSMDLDEFDFGDNCYKQLIVWNPEADEIIGGRLIAIGKMAKLKNHATIPYLVEIHNDYWRGIFKEEHITSTEEQKKRKLAEKEKIRDFISGIENSGKLWIAGYYTTPDGKEVKMVRITRIDTSKDGGDYSDDIAESNNMQCYADNIHPNLVGATPGKSQSNNSGSDKRELFTLKQSIEKAFHDLMETVHWVIIYFNHWEEKVYPDVPLIMLTTLDENKDAKKVSNNPNSKTDD